ncbi:DEAD/DEAH box helicase family protein [Mycoplasma sp. CSL7491-lung]|uniref:type I restriction enzyme subunit R domain-containing protein n=1 Tax=Mycoplasma sp. CSL7491-lung TaxID=549718 RepID=UPI001C1212FA|nr:DEAD/DEAH box helicase family protein [Mycoplasma sp. CSL7491-lung]MBU4692975.1 DEAD/DEAH box helicase family protein [Mycoplasma sp. CSL7491-lung]
MNDNDNLNIIGFNSEKELEEAIIKQLEYNYRVDKNTESLNQTSNQYTKTIYNKTEQDLKQNWCNILNSINKNYLNGYNLTINHIDRILEELHDKKLTEITNGILKYGSLPPIDYFKDEGNNKKYSLVLFKNGGNNQKIIGNNDSVGNFLNTKDPIYQIARQIKFEDIDGIIPDIMLLINGIPVLLIELKLRSSNIKDAVQQIKNYKKRISNFNSIKKKMTMLNFVQILSVMSENKMFYTPNQTDEKNIPDNFINDWLYFTTWNSKDKENKPVHKWHEVVKYFFNIPTIHDMVSKYTVENLENDKLFLLRSYQYHAIHNILERMDKSYRNNDGENKIGYVWHATGSGKTLTSFKLAQLLKQKYNNKKIFMVVDRIALSSQTNDEYKKFSNNSLDIEIVSTKNTNKLKREVKGKNDFNSYQFINNQKIIITTIQKIKKMYESEKDSVIESNKAKSKDFIFIFDEAHRSTDGIQFESFKEMFPNSKFIGFTGTPIINDDVNNNFEKQTTNDIFGSLIHSYTIKDGIKDKKVLPFRIFVDYPKYLVKLFTNTSNILDIQKNKTKEYDLQSLYHEYKQLIEKNESGLDDLEEIEKSKKIIEDKYNIKFKNYNDVDADEYDILINTNNHNMEKSLKIEKELYENNFYNNKAYKNWIVEELIKKTIQNKQNHGGLYSSLFAVESKDDAIEYYNIFEEKLKEFKCKINFTLLFDFSEPNTEKGVIERSEFYDKLLKNYNKMFNTNFKIDQIKDKYKEDILKRLKQEGINYQVRSKDDYSKKLDLLIVVDQLLTGYDSKYIDTIYFDKNINQDYLLIQAISRTNRVLLQTQKEKEIWRPKEYGKIRFFRQGANMKFLLEKAFKKYANQNSGDESNIWFLELKPNIIKEQIEINFIKINEISKKIGFKNDYNRIPTRLNEAIQEYMQTKKETQIIKEAKNFKNYADILLKTWIKFSNLDIEDKNKIINDIKNIFNLDDTSKILRRIDTIRSRAKEIRDILKITDTSNDYDYYDIYNVTNDYFLESPSESFFSEKPDETYDYELLEQKISKNENDEKNKIEDIDYFLSKYNYNDQDYIKSNIDVYSFKNTYELQNVVSQKLNERAQSEINEKYNSFSRATGLSIEQIASLISDYNNADDGNKLLKLNDIYNAINENLKDDSDILNEYYSFCELNFKKDVRGGNKYKISGINSKKCIKSFLETIIKK